MPLSDLLLLAATSNAPAEILLTPQTASDASTEIVLLALLHADGPHRRPDPSPDPPPLGKPILHYFFSFIYPPP
jgi:hypothetical protein